MARRLIIVLLALLVFAPILATIPRNPSARAQDEAASVVADPPSPTAESTAGTQGVDASSPTPTATSTETPTSTATATPTATSTAPAPTATAVAGLPSDLTVKLNCTSNPETIRVTNNGAATITLTSLATLVDKIAAEPFALNQKLLPGKSQLYRAGPAANLGVVLTTSYIFTNSAYDSEGVVISTSVGDISATCPPKPDPVVANPGKLIDLTIVLGCRTNAESIKVTNKGTGYFLLKTIGTTFEATSKEPYQVNQVLAPGVTALFQAGAGAVSGTILTKGYIFTNSAWEKDGVSISTSVGTVTKACDKKPVDAEHWVEVNLSTQFLRAWNGSTVVNSTYVSTGRPGFDTPTGTFRILTKYRYDTMTGTIGGEYYYVPDVPWTMYFTNYGHALHGAYWHNDFGRVRSHGCVNLPLWFAEWLYYWLPYGGRVVIHY
jgi:lipoprotein-anchoring transpeptidase ErfK/SrfK